MDTQNRTQRIADTLERHLTSCDAVLASCLDGGPSEQMGEWPVKRMLSLMKMSAQLANAIVRLEAQGSRIAKSEV